MKFALFGAAAAFATPWHLEGVRLKRLLGEASGNHPDASRRSAAAGTTGAVHSANLWLRLLARIPAGPWRNTCLYRSVAGCLALRWLGEDAILRIGARRDGVDDELHAHAWIEGVTSDVEQSGAYAVLTRGPRTGS